MMQYDKAAGFFRFENTIITIFSDVSISVFPQNIQIPENKLKILQASKIKLKCSHNPNQIVGK